MSESSGAASMEPEHITTSTRDRAVMAQRFEAWLKDILPADSDPRLVEFTSPESNGMSSETLLVTAEWTESGDRSVRNLAVRVEPPATDYPVFTTYDLAQQFEVIRLVGEATSVPVPTPYWFEPNADVLGGAFFVMDRVDGRVPPDVLPYTFGDNWVFDATEEERATLQQSAIEAMVGIHSLRPDSHDLAFLALDQPGARALDRHFASWQDYHAWVVADRPSPLLARAFAWLEEHLPTDVAPDALSWGDGRIGNMLFDGFEVAAVLDWEMAGIAPPEVDLGWMCYLHLFFQDLAVQLGAPGLPQMFRPVDVRAAYEAAGGATLGDLRWGIAYSAIRHGVIMRRVTERSIHFGEATEPEDIDDLIMHRATIEGMIDGSYWEGIAL